MLQSALFKETSMPTITFELSETDMLLVQNPVVHAGAFCHGLVQQYIESVKKEVVRLQIETCTKHGVPIPTTQDDIIIYAYNGEFGFMGQQYRDMLQRQFEAAAKAQAAADLEAYEAQEKNSD
jgi:hypothetical protein